MAFFDPNNTYGGTDWATKNPNLPGAQAALDKGGWANTPYVKKYLDPSIPEGVFFDHLSQRGLNGWDAQSQFTQGLYGRALTGYKAALRQNPALDFRTYLRHEFSVPDVRNMFAAQGPNARGGAGFGRTRTIAWG